MRRDAWLLLAVLLLFACLGAARLNPFCLFEPDSAEYLFGSRSLAKLQGYLEIDRVGEPPHTFRPPGLPLLLVPLSLVRPYDAVTAKVLLLVASLGLLALVWAWTRELAGQAPAAIALLLVATSPYTLLHATEVVSEVPFVLGSLAVIWIVSRPRAGPPSWREVAALSAILGFLPLLRAVGVALAGALALWSLFSPQRRRWLVAVAVSGAVFLLWSWRSRAAGGPTYFGAIQNKLAGGGLEAAESLRFYLARFSQVLLPGLVPGQPVYERLLLAEAPSLHVGWLAGILALVCAGLAVHGAWRRRASGGALALLYVALTFVVLAVYPPRHERLVWPLVPLVWVWCRTRPFLVLGVVLSAWQLYTSVEIARTNLQWRSEGARFYERVPPMYFVDWEAAGKWIGEHAAPAARVVTRHSDVAFTSRRYQQAVRFEETAPADWRRTIAQVHARYLAVPATQFGRLFPAEALRGDPVYTLVPVHETGDAVVLEVRPNRTGTVSAQPAVPESTVEACRRAAQRFPERADLRVRLAELLGERGRVDEALALLRGARARTAREQLALGELLLRAGSPAEARTAFEEAASLPEADLLARRIRRGRTRAEEALQGGHSVEGLLARARFAVEVLRIGDALADVERALARAPGHPEAMWFHGELLQRLGLFEEAESAFLAAQAAGHPDAARKLRLLALQRLPPSFELVMALLEDGTPGHALDVLERTDIGQDPEQRQLLGDLYLFYGDAERAAERYRQVLEARPGDGRAARGLAACDALSRTPRLL